MKIAVTGGTGFVGRNIARALVAAGHEVALISRGCDQTDPTIRALPRTTFHPIGLDDSEQLAKAFAGCQAVAHCAGINRELGAQSYERVHVAGTRNVANAATRAGVRKIALMSFLRARPHCGSGYHESKWRAEEIIRHSALDYTVFKCGVIYGKGDHMLDHLSHAFHTFPVFAFVGFRDQAIRPNAVEDVARLVTTALTENTLSRKTVAVVGPEQLTLRAAVRRVARVVGRKPLMFPLPVWFHYALGWCAQQIMRVPLVSTAQVQMLVEGLAEPSQPCEPTPAELAPRLPFTEDQIRKGLPTPGPFTTEDIRCCRGTWPHRHRAFLELP